MPADGRLNNKMMEEPMAVNEKVVITDNRQVGQDLFVMEFCLPALAKLCKPGQFVHVLLNRQADPLLRRPLSLFDVDQAEGIIRLLYRVVGRGTELLAQKKMGDTIEVMGPLGTGFSLCQKAKAVLVGGGVGIAPLVYLARMLSEKGCQVQVLHGAANKDQLVAASYLDYPGIELWTATMDGSIGFKGLVTELLQEQVDPSKCDFIYTCGPEPMMAAVSEYARQNHISGEVSLEENMACGVGACLGCARKLKPEDENLVKVCKDGPVFDIKAVEF
ncbi:MAG TPA: dihydroorotate dehydrogenase electron transfer subunit [Syntrophomonas sp.]|jgi:dihydroorotate dehydrogenase electron transfer subunit|nr:dihydroorotate dehydrogenase electron transfer subunit [Syntrophomonas sp.]